MLGLIESDQARRGTPLTEERLQELIVWIATTEIKPGTETLRKQEQWQTSH
jgi:hypothetical protein